MGHFEKLSDPKYWTDYGRQPFKGFFTKTIRIAIAAARSFAADDCTNKASSLTFYTLLSIVPVLAVAFGIAKGFGFEEHLKEELLQKFLDQRILADKLIEFAYSTLQSTQGGLIAGIGVIVLFWSVLKLLGSIEHSFNDIWKLKKARSWPRKFSDYLAVTVLGPIFLATSSSLSVFVMRQILNATHGYSMLEPLNPMIYWSFHAFPLFLSWLLFAIIYLIMPNTKVPVSCAFIAGVVAGTAYQLLQWLYINFQLGISSYGAIYGSFAALPLFLFWLNTSWLIVLAGAEIAYHIENDMARSSLMTAKHQRLLDVRLLGLAMTRECVRAFCHGLPPPNLYQLAQKAGVAVVAARNIVHTLVSEHILSEVRWKHGDGEFYQPGRDVKQITIKAVSDALDSSQHEQYFAIYDDEIRMYENKLAALASSADKSADNITLDWQHPEPKDAHATTAT